MGNEKTNRVLGEFKDVGESHNESSLQEKIIKKNNKENSRIAGDVVCYTITTTEYQYLPRRIWLSWIQKFIGVLLTYECEYYLNTSSPT